MRKATVMFARFRSWKVAGLVVLLVALASMGLGACAEEDPGIPGDDGAGPPPPPEVLTARIGPAGGTVEGEAGGPFDGFRLVVPAGALASDVELRIEGTVDATPLPDTAAGIGPQLAILPADLTFAVPAELTVPFTPTLRNRWDTPDEECRVWYRDGDGWSRADAIDATPISVTVELGATTTVGAGVIRSIQPTGCLFGCSAAAPPVATCLDGDRLCIERLGAQHVGDRFDAYSYTQGVLYWLTTPSSNSVALAGFDTLSRRPITTSGTLVTTVAATVPIGEVVVDGTGARWLGVRNVGNLRFDGTRLPSLFDSAAANLPLGVTLDTPSGEVIRWRYNRLMPSPDRLGSGVTAVRDGRTFSLGVADGTGVLDEVLQLQRSTSSSTTAQISSSGWGTMERTVGRTGSTQLGTASCGRAAFRSLRAVSVSPTRNVRVAICTGEGGVGALTVNGTARTEFAAGQVPSGLTTVDSRDVVYLVELQKAQITRFATDGSITVIPLSTAAPSSAEYAAMIPQSIHYDSGLDALVLVTRGTGGTPEFHQITELR